MDDVQGSKRFLSDGNAFRRESIAAMCRRWRDVAGALQSLQQAMRSALAHPRFLRKPGQRAAVGIVAQQFHELEPAQQALGSGGAF